MKAFRKIVIVAMILALTGMAMVGCGTAEVEEDGDVVLKQLAFVYEENTIAISDIVDDQKIESMLGKADEIRSHTYSENDGKNMDQLNGMT